MVVERDEVVPRLLGELGPGNHLIRRFGCRCDEDAELNVVAVIADANSVHVLTSMDEPITSPGSPHAVLRVQLRFDLELEVHLVTDDDDAGFEDRVEVDPKVTPVEPADRSGSGARARLRVGRKAPQVKL